MKLKIEIKCTYLLFSIFLSQEDSASQFSVLFCFVFCFFFQPKEEINCSVNFGLGYVLSVFSSDLPFSGSTFLKMFLQKRACARGRGGGALPIMDYTEKLRPKGVPFSGWRYIKG